MALLAIRQEELFSMPQSENNRQIATLNDAFRTSFNGGTLFMTAGIQALPEEVQVEILYKVRTFDEFTPDNDPHGEHDFGSLTVQGHRVFWKIDYYDLNIEYHSENAADSLLTNRVLTVMLAGEY
jgi:hypothetical protein